MQSFKMRLNRFVRSRCTLDFRFDTLEELNRISDAIYDDSVYHACDSDRF